MLHMEKACPGGDRQARVVRDLHEVVSTSPVLDIFGPSGLLARHLPGYEPRGGQMTMAQTVANGIDTDTHAIIEAPTGTGKSLAYTFPTVTRAIEEDRQVLIVTGGITLQEQLAKKDLPFVRSVLPEPFTFTVLKGMANYLCRERVREFGKRVNVPAEVLESLSSQVETVLAWADETSTGDRSELSVEPDSRLWSLLSVDSSDCLEEACPFHQDGCFARAARERARQSTVFIVNYHLLFVHVMLFLATGEHVLLPPFDIVILDEAHQAAHIARDVFGSRLSLYALRKMTSPLERAGRADLRNAIHLQAERFCDALAAHRDSAQYKVRIRTPDCVDSHALVELLLEAERAYGASAVALGKRQEAAPKPSSDHEEQIRRERARDIVRFRQCRERCRKAAERIHNAMELADDGQVYFIEEDRKGRGVLCARQLDVSQQIGEGLFAQARHVTATSATLSTAGSFELLRGELGIPDAEERIVRSPFNLERQALLIVPDDVPDPNDPAWPATVARTTREVIENTHGRTLGLYTSHRNLGLAHRAAKECGYPVLRQGDAPRSDLIQRFRERPETVLLGTESFWTGVDVPGESCSCVLIDRLPFPRLDDPVMDAIQERHPRDWFTRFYLPKAVIAFKQGFGRLIRASTDRGVVVVLDPRLLSKPYGRYFLIDFPGLRVERDLEVLSRFLDFDMKETQR